MRSVSTTWEWRLVKIERAAGPEGSARRRRSTGIAEPRDWRRRQTLQVKYRGGAEAWWEFSMVGTTVRIPGHICLHDAMARVLGQAERSEGRQAD